MPRGTSHFYSVFSVNGFGRVDFWYDNYGLWPWLAKARPKTAVTSHFGNGKVYFTERDVIPVCFNILWIRFIPEDHNPLRERDIRLNRKLANALENQYSQSVLLKNNDNNGHPCMINCNI